MLIRGHIHFDIMMILDIHFIMDPEMGVPLNHQCYVNLISLHKPSILGTSISGTPTC